MFAREPPFPFFGVKYPSLVVLSVTTAGSHLWSISLVGSSVFDGLPSLVLNVIKRLSLPSHTKTPFTVTLLRPTFVAFTIKTESRVTPASLVSSKYAPTRTFTRSLRRA